MHDRVIHIATVHWKNDKWIKHQISSFKTHIQVPYRVYGYLTHIDDRYYDAFDVVIDGPDLSHAEKLNALATRILQEADDSDIILFIDGDAFPIDRLDLRLSGWLEDWPLVAIRRMENLGEKHPHPSFCATTVGTWRQLGGNWNKGYTWINALNVEETDVGAELLRALDQTGTKWYPLERTNAMDILPVWYGIYGDLIYHHGAGFRDRGCRKIWHLRGLYQMYQRADARILNMLFRNALQKRLRNSMLHPEGRLKRKINKELIGIDEKVAEQIASDFGQFIRALRFGAEAAHSS